MKKICNFVKIWVIWTLLGETVASYYKDKEFKEKFDNAKGFDKIKVIFNNLIDVNKKFFTELSSVDYNLKYNEFKSKVEENIDHFNKKLDDIKENISNYKEEKISPVLEDIYNKANEFKEKIENEAINLSEKYKLEEKLTEVKEKISKIKENLNK